MIPLCRHKKTSLIYEFLGENLFRNVITGKTGTVPDELAREIFVFNLELSMMVVDNPVILEMIKRLGLRVEK